MTGRIGEDLPLLDHSSLYLVEVELFYPLTRNVHVVIVEIALLEHLEGELLVANHDPANLVEVAGAHVAAIFVSPVIRAPPDRHAVAFDDILILYDVLAA